MLKSQEVFDQGWKVFSGDANLVAGPMSVEDAFVAPEKTGIYSIRLPKQPMTAEQQADTRVVLLSCMDKRVVRNLYDRLVAEGYKPEEIMVISMGGGGVHTRERMAVLKQVIGQVLGKDGLDHDIVEKIVVSGHDEVCGAAKFYGGGEEPLHKIVNMRESELMKRLIVGGYEDLIPQEWQDKVDLGLAHVKELGSHKYAVEWQPIDVTQVKPLRVGEILGK